MDKKEECLNFICDEIKKDCNSEFSRKTLLKILELIPSVPRVPGANVFYELCRKVIPLAIDMVFIKDHKVLLVYRKDAFYDGWHFPGFYRQPYTSLLEDAQNRAHNEVGKDVKIIKVEVIGTRDHFDNPRFHDFGLLTLCQFEGTPNSGEWFREMPKMIPIQEKYWEYIIPFIEQPEDKKLDFNI